jgi:hypothetical protein
MEIFWEAVAGRCVATKAQCMWVSASCVAPALSCSTNLLAVGHVSSIFDDNVVNVVSLGPALTITLDISPSCACKRQ